MEWVVVAIIRIVVPLAILRWSLAGSVLALIADTLDVVILDFLGVKDFRNYSAVDKYLDVYMSLLQGYTLFSWKNIIAKRAGISILSYRLVGVFLFEITQKRMLLFFFPNVFEFYYFFYLIYKKILKREPFKSVRQLLVILLLLLIPKLLQEYIHHVIEFPIYIFFKNIFSNTLSILRL